MSNKIYTGYHPRKHQALLHQSLKRFSVLVCHRRLGKTVFSVNEMIDQALRNQKRMPQYAYIAPTYGQAKRVAWEMIKDYTKSIPNTFPNEADLRIDIKRPQNDDFIRFMLLGAEKPGSIRGIYLDGVIMDEFAECDPTVWSQVVRPTLSDRFGWAIFIGTPKGMNHFYEIYQIAKKNEQKDWFHCMYKASETNIIHPAELEAARATMTEEEYAQEFECSFSAALVGAYFGKELSRLDKDNRICGVPYDRYGITYCAWDLGIGDTTAIWFAQVVGREIHCFDYLETSGEGLEYYVREIKDRGYDIAGHLLPHDAGAKELGTGKTRIETLRGLGLKRLTLLPKWSIADRINAARKLLPRCWFDQKKTSRGVDSLRNYQRKWDSKNMVFQPKPLHNWASHGAEAFCYLAMGLDDEDPSARGKRLPRHAEQSYDIFNLGGH